MNATHPLLEELLLKVGATTGEAPSNEVWRDLLGRVSSTIADLEGRTESDLARERHRVAESLAILSATLEATEDAILIVDRNRRVVAWNGHFTTLLGVPDHVIETRDHRTVVEYSARQFRDPEAIAESIMRMHDSREVQHDELECVDGRIIDRYSSPVRLPDGQAVGRVTYFRDVTAERQAAAAREHARQAAEAASRAKSMFLANMSHELRTPLNAVIGLADLLLLGSGGTLSDRHREYVEHIMSSGRHLLAMVNDVLDLSKIEAGKERLVLERVSTSDLVGDAVQVLQTIARQRGVELTVDIAPDVPDLRADPIRLRQILYNLISNAVKFTDRDGRVLVSAVADERGVAIRVADTGIGIAAEDMPRLFRSFEQLNLPSGDRPTGTGLGLALTKRLVDMHGASIQVVSQLGAGSTFIVRFPMQEDR